TAWSPRRTASPTARGPSLRSADRSAPPPLPRHPRPPPVSVHVSTWAPPPPPTSPPVPAAVQLPRPVREPHRRLLAAPADHPAASGTAIRGASTSSDTPPCMTSPVPSPTSSTPGPLPGT